jgi:hypothetical protein
MTSIEYARLKMFLLVKRVVDCHPDIFCSSPHLCQLHDRFLANTRTISELNQQCYTIRQGVGKQKALARQQLCESTASICLMAMLYARMIADTELKKRIYHSKRNLTLYSDTKFLEVARMVNSEVAGMVPTLTPFGITSEVVDQHAQHIDQLVALAPTPQQSIAQRKGITQNLKSLFKENIDILELVDIGINLVKDRHCDVYAQYRSARKVLVPGLRHLALRAYLLDSLTLEGVGGVKVTLTPHALPKSKSKKETKRKPVVKLSGSKGIFNIRSLPEGTYDVVVTKQGYQTITTTITVEHGTMYKLELLLVPIL